MSKLLVVFLLIFAAIFRVHAQSDAYPVKPIRLIVGFAPGGGSDFIARLVAPRLADRIGQPVLVENRPGGGGNLGAETAIRSAADGYTLFLAATSYTINASLYKMSFDAVRDIQPIIELARGPFIIVVHPSVAATSLRELVELARRDPNGLAFATSGRGSVIHLASEYFQNVAGIELLHVPYKGTGPALADTVSGQTQVLFGSVASTLPFVKASKLRALAVTGATRLAALPDIPTVAQAGIAGYESGAWHGLIGPKGIPPAIVARLNRTLGEVLSAGGMEAQLASDGLTASGGSPDSFGATIAADVARWAEIVKRKGIRLD